MSKTVIIELPLPVASNVLNVVKEALKDVDCQTEDGSRLDNYKRGLSYAYLDCARAVIEEVIEND